MPPGVPGLPQVHRPRGSRGPRDPSGAGQLRDAQDPEGAAWFKKHPRYHLHFTPTPASWLNQVERWFARITQERIRRSAFRSVAELEKAILAYIEENNRKPKPFVGTATADLILGKVKDICERINPSLHGWYGTGLRPSRVSTREKAAGDESRGFSYRYLTGCARRVRGNFLLPYQWIFAPMMALKPGSFWPEPWLR